MLTVTPHGQSKLLLYGHAGQAHPSGDSESRSHMPVTRPFFSREVLLPIQPCLHILSEPGRTRTFGVSHVTDLQSPLLAARVTDP